MPKPTVGQLQKRFRRTPPNQGRRNEHVAVANAVVDLAIKLTAFYPDSDALRVCLNKLDAVIMLIDQELSERT